MEKLLEREEAVMKQLCDSYADDVNKCLEYYYLTPLPKTAQEIVEQCIFIGREEEIANTKEV